MKPLRVSVGIPVYNEEANISELVARLTRVLDGVAGGPHEVLFVDDGSTDSTYPLLAKLASDDDRFRVLSFSRNFGHQAAVSAAIDHAQGDVLVLMDGDLQDAPEAIPTFLEHHARGNDVVYAIRVQRKEGILLRAAYSLFYKFMAVMSDVRIPAQAGDFGLMSAAVVRHLRSLPERSRYVRGLRTWVGYRQIGVDVERDARFSGQPKYTLAKLIKLAIDGLFSFSVKPIRAALLTGTFILIGCALYSAYAVYAKFVLDQSPQGFTTLILFMNFLAGVQLTFLGLIGEYVGRIFEEVKARPGYIIRETAGKRAP